MRGICSLLKSQGVQSAAASAVLLIAAASGAVAQPASGSLPGGFSASQSTTYTGSGSTATITTGAGNAVLQWGGSALTNPVSAPGGLTTNTGFSIGSGASLAITNGKAASSSVLVNDLTGSPSQIYGALDASGVGGPLYIANASGIIVGNTGVITAPSDGIGLLGYAVPSSGFDGTVSISKTQATTGGSVTVVSGASVTGGLLLAAGTDTVNVALKGTHSSTYVSILGSGEASATSTTCNGKSCITSGVYGLAGEAFSTNAGSVLPVVTVSSPSPHRHW